MRYSEDFKKQVLVLLRGGKTYRQIKSEFGISIGVISKWAKKYPQETPPRKAAPKESELERLRKRVDELEAQNLVYKKALAVFILRP